MPSIEAIARVLAQAETARYGGEAVSKMITVLAHKVDRQRKPCS